MNRCMECGRERLPHDLCCCEQEGCCSCRGRRCIRCCINLWSTRNHDPVVRENGEYDCRVCRRLFREGCLCCEHPRLDRCPSCCEAYRHLCCKKQSIRFINPPNEPLFWTPQLIPSKGKYNLLGREDSIYVLNKEHKINPVYLTKNRSTRYAATELEVSSMGDAKELNSILTHWRCAVVHDSTTGDTGFEINTTPACGNALYEELYDICTSLTNSKAKVTTNCGLHVHVDCRDYGYQEVQRFVKVYSVLESALFAAMHRSRLDSEFCFPCGSYFTNTFIKGIKPDTPSLKKALIPTIYGVGALTRGTSLGGSRPQFHVYRQDHYGRVDRERNTLRYSAVNLHSYFLRGTIEFRMHHAAIDFVEVYGWTKLLIALMDSVMKISSGQLEQILNVSGTEVEGCMQLNPGITSPEVAKGLVVLASLIPLKYVEHLISKIQLVSKHPSALPANLFYAFRSKQGTGIDIDEAGLTKV